MNEIIDNKYNDRLLYNGFLVYILILGITLNFKINRLYHKSPVSILREDFIVPINDRTDLTDQESEEEKNESIPIISDEKVSEIKRKILKLIEIDKVYLNPNLSILFLAKKINTNYKYISQVINKEFDKNFFTLINEYRIEYAKHLLSNPENDILTIEALAEKAGFNSKSAFNSAFKKYVGITPKEFKKESRD